MHCASLRSVAVTTAILAAASWATCTAQAEIILYTTDLTGDLTGSPGIGIAEIDHDDVAHTMRVQVAFSGLEAITTVAHVHSPTAEPFTGTAGVAFHTGTFPGFPVGVTAGSYDQTFDMTDTAIYTATFLTNSGGTAAGAEAALVASFVAGTAYLNVHTTQFPAGEIRGFLQPIPEPSMFVLLGAGAIAALVARSCRRRGSSMPLGDGWRGGPS